MNQERGYVLDALGREVPPWAREAYAIMAADGRRVAVGDWPWLGLRETPAMAPKSDARIHERYVGIYGHGAPATIVHLSRCESLADAARRALADEVGP